MPSLFWPHGPAPGNNFNHEDVCSNSQSQGGTMFSTMEFSFLVLLQTLIGSDPDTFLLHRDRPRTNLQSCRRRDRFRCPFGHCDIGQR